MNSKLKKTKMNSCFLLSSVFLTAVAFLNGCKTTSTKTAERDTLTSNIGLYPPPPAGIVRVRVGVPPFQIENAQLPSGGGIESLAADQLTTLAVQTGRFKVVERAQLTQLLAEQGLEGIVRPEELAASGQVRGIDYLLIGKVTNFRVEAEGSRKGFNAGALTGLVDGLGGDTPLGLASTFDFHSNKRRYTVECGVDLRLADAETGEVVVAHFGEFSRTDTVGAMGIGFAGWSDESDVTLSLDSDNQGKILRLVLDDTIRKMLPRVDAFLMSRRSALKARASSVPAPAYGSEGTAIASEMPRSIESKRVEGAPRFCPSCGGKLEPGARFCGNCGANTGIAQTNSSRASEQGIASPPPKQTAAPEQTVGFCSRCGAKVEPTDKFCGKCGAKHSGTEIARAGSSITGGQRIASPAPKQVVAQQQMVAFCSRCGAKVSSTDKFCAKCGVKVPATEPALERAERTQENVPAPIIFADEQP
jgi:curli biogenesis system outer membrane secretion channel CsgG/predicted amidophosphoribosyltransferase